jgi:predicted  nucleic acid-binding Zn-ribbon protein
MGATLEALLRLQEIENQLRSTREQVESKRRAAQSHQRKIATIERQIADAHELGRQAQSDADRLELDRKTHDAHLTKLREALNRSKTNKEYAAILTQLNTDKADALKLEDQVLSAMAKVDEHRKQEAEQKASLEKERTRQTELEKAAAEVEARLAGKVRDLEAQREDAAQNIPSEALQRFERACEYHEGEAMAQIEQPHPKRAEYICSGCHMSITLETINALQSRDVVVQCNSCSRILYIESALV